MNPGSVQASKAQASALVARSLGEQALAEARVLLGTPIRVEQWNNDAGRDVIMNVQLEAFVRGARTLYWKEGVVGESLPGTVRGPINPMDMTPYYAGAPGPCDNGPQRCGMLATCVTYWMGGDGWLRTYSTRLKLPVIFGDITYCKGRIKDKRLYDGRGIVELERWTENQLGQVTMSGHGTVELPRRPAV